ncbi:hypothetical protein HPP92_005318 [Vanilla planifolia]|uniref:Conserved oligomeric Golgi complex subunit 7 n=1 Tax=Vanilla planifolia TaxID=51239 RepID=A0A835VCI2_VANPL|nr:hypothetical protein HPP92_005318 [Vanilla planifolia]
MSKDPRFHALPLASQRVAAFADTVNELVYDVLISKVRQRLNDVSRLPVWSSVEEASGLPLPSFSSYPQAYVTSVGEYLLTLPQQLEPLVEGFSSNEGSNEEGQILLLNGCSSHADACTTLKTLESTELAKKGGSHHFLGLVKDSMDGLNEGSIGALLWLSWSLMCKAPTPDCHRTLRCHCKENIILPFQLLQDDAGRGCRRRHCTLHGAVARNPLHHRAGAQQLSADIEYLSNVLSALSMPIPQFLSTFQTCVSNSRDELRKLLKSDSGDQLDLPTVHLVCKIRRISVD